MTDITVYYSTNRLPFETNDPIYVDKLAFSKHPSAFDGKALRFGKAQVSVAPGRTGTLKQVEVASEKLIAESANGKIKVGSRKLFEELQQAAMDGDGDVIFVIHGYANDFKGGVIGAAEIAERLGRKCIFAFCWPATEGSTGPFTYADARANARVSGNAIGRAFAILINLIRALEAEGRFCNKKIDVIAHSMGAYALRIAIQSMNHYLKSEEAIRLIDDLILVGADDDNDTLERGDGMMPIVPFCRSVTVYHTKQDLALQVADHTKFKPDRLGQTGPRTMNAVADSIYAVDVSLCIDDPNDGFVDHWYHRRSPKVIADIKATLEFKGFEAGSINGGRRKPVADARRRFLLQPE